jgi:nitroimidazol reductase NimA-like FMN-containing flavoprotein (pyridoxamine 5'-phosphate oxidase superfamily)
MVDPVTGAGTKRTRIRRLPDKAVTDRAALDAVLDEGLVAHVGLIDDDAPFVLPVGYARRGNQVIVHGSSGSRLLRAIADGTEICLSVTLLDGIVYARSLFESSMNYRSAMILGRATRLTGDDELDALRTLSEHLAPGRWEHARQPSAKERAATITAALPITEWSVKVSEGDPEDDPSDLESEPWRSLWAGYLPMRYRFDAPVTDPLVPPGTQVPPYVSGRS